jgi:cation diffusion facilitator family transporter
MKAHSDSDRHRTLVLMVWCEVVAFLFVLAAAWPTNSLTLWASALRVGLELPASFFALYVSARMLRGRQGKYDYGLGKWENLGSLLNVPVMFIGLAFLAFRVFQHFLDPQPVTKTAFGLTVLLIFGGVNLALMLRFLSLNQSMPSPLIYAQFILYRNALAASLLSVLALMGSWLAGPMGIYFDMGGAVLLAGLILQSGLLLLRQSLSALLDETVEESLQDRIAEGLAGAALDDQRLQRIRSRHAGGRIFIELFVEFPSEISVQEMMRRIGKIKSDLSTAIPHAEVTVIPSEHESLGSQALD